jgi:branched-chain amino acid transport system ATP-binding protein
MSLLEISDVSVRFGGVTAVDSVSLAVEPGGITSLIGPNGAGKTTLFNVVSGLQRPNAGNVCLAGRDITRDAPHRRARLGLARTFQRLETFGSLTVQENIEVALRSSRRWRADHDLSASALLDLVGLADLAAARVSKLPTGLARLVEVARALAVAPKLLLLDEPSSGLTQAESERFGDLLVRLSGRGLAVLLVEHDVSLVMRVSATVNVLDFGHLIASGTPAAVRRDATVQAAYLGDAEHLPAPGSNTMRGGPATASARPVSAVHGAPPTDLAPPALDLADVSAGYGQIRVLDGVDLLVPAGNVQVLLGPNGAGKSTLLKVASRQLTPRSGRVHALGRDLQRLTPAQVVRLGVATIPEGRGIFPNLTVRENLTVMTYAAAQPGNVHERAYEQFPVLGRRRRQLAGTLSGGEQQMLALARALVSEPKLILIDELALGLAPQLGAQLYAAVAAIARTGPAILLVEQYSSEALEIAHEAALMLGGQIVERGAPHDVASALADSYLGVRANALDIGAKAYTDHEEKHK